MPERPMLEVGDVSLQLNAARIGPVIFTLPNTGCWWLLGPSGAGKSLLLATLAGFHGNAVGSIRVAGHEVCDLPPETRSITLMPQRWRLFPHWSVRRNLEFAAKLGKTGRDRIRAMATKLQIENLLDRPAQALSGGEAQRAVLIQTLLSSARVVLLDEPLAAIDQALKSAVLDLVEQEMAAQNRICLIAAHQAPPGHALQGCLRIASGQLEPTPQLATPYPFRGE